MLFRKAVRSLWSAKKSYFACVFLIATGILMYVAMGVASRGLERSTEEFYWDYAMPDVFAKVEAMPVSRAEELREVPGVKAVTARYTADVWAQVDDSDETITLRLLTYDPSPDALSRLRITGSPIADDSDMIVNPKFYEAHGLDASSTVTVYARGRETAFAVCATALCPEHAYITKNEMEILPDEKGFGIGYITWRAMEALTGQASVANEVVLTLQDGVSFEEVKASLEDRLSSFGLVSLIGRKDHQSFAYVDLELKSTRSMSTSIPLVFIFIAMVVLYLMMKRMIEQERTQIGTLKAFGFSKQYILSHYVFYGLVTGLAGGVAGCVLGTLVSGAYLDIFLDFFLIPPPASERDLAPLAGAMLIALIGGALGAYMGARASLRLAPAEAMRAEAPKAVKFAALAQGLFLSRILTPRGRMAARSVFRNPMRSGFVLLGITLSFALLSIAGSFDSLIDKMVYSQFTDIQRFQVKLVLKKPLDAPGAMEEVYAVGGVRSVEGLLEVPVEILHENMRAGVLITGVDKDSSLLHLVDTNTKERFLPPENGVVLTNGIASSLRVKEGDRVRLKTPLREGEEEVVVVRVIEQNLGSACYIERQALCRLLDLPDAVSAVILNTDDLPHLKEYLKQSVDSPSIQDKESTLQKTKDTMDLYTGMFFLYEVVGILVAYAIVYNTSTISLSERKREYATLRVLGFSVKEISGIMGFEYALLGALGMLLGIPTTLALNHSINGMMDTALFTMPSSLPLSAYGMGVAGCLIAIVLSNWSAKKKIGGFDMVEVLKERE